MQKALTVGILVPRKRQRKAVLKTYCHYNSLDIKLISFSLDDIDWKKKRIRSLYMRKGSIKEKVVPFPQVLYNRCYYDQTKKLSRMEKIIGKNKTFNTINRLNKWQVHRILASTRVKEFLPDTCLYEEKQLQNFFQKNKLIYLKPCLGNQGRGVFRLEKINNELRISKDSLPPRYIWNVNDKQLPRKVNKLLKGKPYILQSGISFTQIDERHFDLRVLVQINVSGEWEITNMISRVTYKQYYNTSIFERILLAEEVLETLFPIDKLKIILDKLGSISIDTAIELDQAIGLMAELSIDYGIDDNGALWMIEVNGKPQKNIYSDILDPQERSAIYQRPLEYALFLAQSHLTDVYKT